MNDEFWFSRIESVVFDKIVKKTSDYLKPKYPNISYTDFVSETPTQFPCVEITEIEGTERGNTLANDEISAYMSTFQVNVYSDSSKQIARDVMSEIVMCFKKELAFNVLFMPIYAKNGNIHRFTARFRRMIGAGDTIVI